MTSADRYEVFFMERTDIQAFVLAGGQSSRAGYDKLLTAINKTTLVEKTISACDGMFCSVSLVAKSAEKYGNLPVTTLIDSELADGPMAGIITALENCDSEFCFITAADLYDLDKNVITEILQAYTNEQFLGAEINNRIQPLCAIYHKSCLPLIVETAKSGNYKMRDFLKQVDSKFIPLTISPWRNVNYHEDFESIRSEHV